MCLKHKIGKLCYVSFDISYRSRAYSCVGGESGSKIELEIVVQKLKLKG